MNLTRSEKVRLGAFIGTGLFMFIGGVLTLAGLKVWEQRDEYTVRFKESVSGLEASAQVKYQGLRVGRVDRMQIDPKDPGSIMVMLSLEEGTPLYEGTEAVLDMSGITGLKTINLTAGDPRKPLIKPGTELPTGKSLVDTITGRAEAISAKVEAIANNLNKWTDDDNRKRIEQLVDHVDKLVVDVDGFLLEAKGPFLAALEDATKTSAAVRGTANAGTKTLTDLRGEFKQTMVAARGAINEANKLLKAVDDKAINETIYSARDAMGQLNQRVSGKELGQTLTDLRVALVNTTRLLSEMDLAVRASREDFVASLKYIRQASQDLREFSRIIAQDPSVLLRGTEVGE